MSYVSVCKNIIQQNNKKQWIDPDPTIRISKTKSGKAVNRAFNVGIVDKDGNIVAKLVSSNDGKPILKCGAKVVLETEFDVVTLEN